MYTCVAMHIIKQRKKRKTENRKGLHGLQSTGFLQNYRYMPSTAFSNSKLKVTREKRSTKQLQSMDLKDNHENEERLYFNLAQWLNTDLGHPPRNHQPEEGPQVHSQARGEEGLIFCIFPIFRAALALADNLVILQARNRIYTGVTPCPDKIEVTRDRTERKMICIRVTEGKPTFPESRGLILGEFLDSGLFALIIPQSPKCFRLVSIAASHV